MIVGVGTGSTVDLFIDALASANVRIRGAISSSEASTARLRKHGIEVVDLNSADAPEVYIDGADEADSHLRLIKGGGASLNNEVITNEMMQVTSKDLQDGAIKLSAGKKRHVLVKPAA